MNRISYSALMVDRVKLSFGEHNNNKPKIAIYLTPWRVENNPPDCPTLLELVRDVFQDKAIGGILVYALENIITVCVLLIPSTVYYSV